MKNDNKPYFIVIAKNKKVPFARFKGKLYIFF